MRKHIGTGVAAALLLAAIGGASPARSESSTVQPPAPTRRVAASKPAHSVLGPTHDRRHLVVKFAEGTDVRARGGRFESAKADVSRANALLAVHGARAEPGFAQDEASLDEMTRRARAKSGHELADLNLYADVFLSDGLGAETLLDALNAEPSVEIAYASLQPSEPSHTATPNYTAQQGYANPATAGVDVAYARTFTGGNGAGVRIVDVERGWRFAHEDLALPASTLISGVVRPGSIEHGTAVLGELVGRQNGFGVTGLVPGSSVRASSACRTLVSGECGTSNVAQAINDASWHLLHDGVRAGVILIEQQFTDPKTGMFVPVEFQQGEYDAIRTAAASGITVVEAAGNGGQNLDNVKDAAGRYVLRRSVRDSLAIMVGAGYAPGCAAPCTDRAAVNRPGWWGSNFGGRVDVQGWGENVTTTGYGTLFGDDAWGDNANRYYTQTFNGTSSASPVVTGAVAALQGISVARTGFPMGPMYALLALKNTGSPQPSTDASSRPIGPRPDLRKAIPWMTGFGAYAYRITSPAVGSSHGGSTMSISVRLNVLYVGSIDRFEVGAYYSNSPAWSKPYWHAPVAVTQFSWLGTNPSGNCLGWWDCTVSATWNISGVPSQQVILHGWAVDAQEGFGSNWLPQVKVNVT